MNEMKFTKLDLQTWKRGQMFYYFSKMAPTGYSLTVKIDVTNLRNCLKEAGLKFFPTYLWLVTTCINEQVEFKVAQKDGELGYYDTLTPMYASFHDDDKLFSLMWTEYDEDFQMFYKNYQDNQIKYGKNKGVLCQQGMMPPENCYTVSSIPWVGFEHFAVHSYENKPYYFPSVEAGAFVEENGKIYMPMSITCHHATTDGWHVKVFLESLNRKIEEFIDRDLIVEI